MAEIISRVILIIAVIAIVSGATYAYINDIEVADSSTFAAQKYIQVGDASPTTWRVNISDVKPGDSGSDQVLVKNIGGENGFLHVTFSNRVNDEMGCIEPESYVDITCENPGNNSGELAQNLNLLIYLDDLQNGNFDLGTDTLIYQGKAKGILQGDTFNYNFSSVAEKVFRIEWSLDSAVGNIAQTDKAGFDILFELTQIRREIVGDWHLDENAGTKAYDSSGHANTGTLSGASWSGGKYNPALSFDGVNDYVQILGSDSLNITGNITLEAWINPASTIDSSNSNMRVVDKQGAYYLLFDYPSSDGKMKFVLRIGGSYVNVSSATSSWSAGTWYHIAGTYNGSVMKVYVNGTLENSKAQAGSIQTSGYKLFFGTRANSSVPTNMYFNGTIDEVRIYPVVLSGAEILQHFNAGV